MKSMKKARNSKNDRHLVKQVAKYNQEQLFNKEFQSKQKKRRAKQFKFLTETTQEKELWHKFKALIHEKRQQAIQEHPDKKVYFDFEHINELGVDWNLLIVMGEKNIGKTYAESQLVRRTIEQNPDAKFFFVRTTKKELTGAFKNQLDEGKEWPIRVASKSETPFKLVWKEHEPKPPDRVHWKSHYMVGWATHVNGNGLTSSQGSGYENLKYCIWDEFNDDGNLKRDYKERLLRFFLSIQRNNKDFRVIMAGNLLSKEGVASHVMLDEFGIPFDARLKYRETKHLDQKTGKYVSFKLLYINIGSVDELYDGVQSQSFTYMFGEESARDLITNQPAYRTSKVVNKVSFLKASPWFSWVTTYENIHYCIYLGQAIISWTAIDKSYYYIMHIDYYTKDNTELGYSPISDEITTTNLFGMLLKSWSEVVADKFNTLQMIIEAGALYFSDDPTRELFNNKLYPMLLKRYDTYLKDWF